MHRDGLASLSAVSDKGGNIYFECAPDGDYMALRRTGMSVLKKRDWKRGDVRAFSFRSRSRLMKKLAQVKKHRKPLFVTLTYPDKYPGEFEEYKYHLHKFVIYLFRKFPNAGLIWKLEYQKRGAAHYHIFLWGVPYYARNVIVSIWHKIAGGGDVKHALFHMGWLRNTVHCVQEIQSWQGVKSYASKYFTKLDNSTDKPGRFWGVRGDVPFSPILQLKIDLKTALEFRRAYRRKYNFEPRRFGFWGYGYSFNWLHFIEFIEEQIYIENNPPPDKWEEARLEILNRKLEQAEASP